MSIYDDLGIQRIINGSATLTRLGGSLMPPEVLAAMAEAATAFVDIVELQRRVGEEIARLTRNEAAYVSCGAAAGLTLTTAAAIAGRDPELRARLPQTDGLRNEVIVHSHTRVGYDFAIRMAGGKFVEIGSRAGTTAAELEAAITPRTAAMFYFARGTEERGELPLETAVEVCRPRGIRVIVDAAAQIPPASNLWSYTERGADASLFSGGKGLRGPQAAGLVLGRKDLIEQVAFHGPPSPFIGRGMKVGKEELCGMLAAVRVYLAQDEAALLDRYERQVEAVIAAFADDPRVTATRAFPSEAGQPMPRALLRLDTAALGRSGAQVRAALMAGDPGVAVSAAGEDGLNVNPQTLEPGEERIVIQRLREALR